MRFKLPLKPFSITEGRPGDRFKHLIALMGVFVFALFSLAYGAGLTLVARQHGRITPWVGLFLLPGVAYVLWIQNVGVARFLSGMITCVKAAREIAAGDLESHIPMLKGSLTTELGAALNEVRERLAAQNEELIQLNANLEEQVRKRTLALELLSAVGAGLNESLDVGVILENSLNALTRIAGWPMAAIYILDEEELKLATDRGLPPFAGEQVKRGDPGQGLVGRAATGNGTQVWHRPGGDAEAPSADAAWLGPGSAVPGIASAAFTSMTCKRRNLGVLVVASPERHDFTAEELGVLYAAASEIAVAVENAQLYAKAKRMAERDSVTDLLNHGEFYRRLRRELVRAVNLNRRLSVLMIDADEFKRFNDTYGHLHGDQALRDLGRELKASVRDNDVVARYGGEEFAVIAVDADSGRAHDMAGRIRDRVAILGRQFRLPTVSIGVAAFPEDGNTAEDLISVADRRLYRAKSLGRNQVVGAVED
ncbi:MAG TPA: sensor domain-containing diguanylate cyclase [Bacillota bacterium]